MLVSKESSMWEVNWKKRQIFHFFEQIYVLDKDVPYFVMKLSAKK